MKSTCRLLVSPHLFLLLFFSSFSHVQTFERKSLKKKYPGTCTVVYIQYVIHNNNMLLQVRVRAFIITKPTFFQPWDHISS